MELGKGKKRILIIEDDKSIRELYAVALVKAGFDIVMAEDGLQGIEMALNQKPDLILLDIEMPVMDGHQAAEKLRLDEWGKTTKIIFLTNRSEAQHVAHAVTLEPEKYVIKANTPVKEIVNIVRTALR